MFTKYAKDIKQRFYIGSHFTLTLVNAWTNNEQHMFTALISLCYCKYYLLVHVSRLC